MNISGKLPEGGKKLVEYSTLEISDIIQISKITSHQKSQVNTISFQALLFAQFHKRKYMHFLEGNDQSKL